MHSACQVDGMQCLSPADRTRGGEGGAGDERRGLVHGVEHGVVRGTQPEHVMGVGAAATRRGTHGSDVGGVMDELELLVRCRARPRCRAAGGSRNRASSQSRPAAG